MQAQGIKSIKKLGVQKCMDFSVDSEDHNFYAEGIVTSNCYSYSYITAYTTYLKANYPLAFYYACLKMSQHEADPIDCISKIQGELKNTDIKLLMPDILKSQEDYTIENGNIQMGLSAVKGLAGAALEKIKGFKAVVTNRFDLFLSLSQNKIPLNVVGSLILSGGFDSIRGESISRNSLLFHYEIFNELTPREIPIVHNLGPKYNYDLPVIIRAMCEDLQDIKGKPLMKDSRRQTLRRDCEAFRLKHQKNSKFEALTEYLAENYYLGFSYSHTLKGIYSKHITGLINLKELKSSKAGKYRVVAQLSESENRVSKNKKPYIKYTLKDDSDTLICMNFNLDATDGKEYGLKMKDDSIACWHIEKKTREDGEIYFVSDIVEQEVPTVLKTSVVRKELEENGSN